MRSTKGFIAPTRDDIQKISKTENGPEASEQSEKDSLALSTDSEYYSDDFESDTDETMSYLQTLFAEALSSYYSQEFLAREFLLKQEQQ